MTGEPAADSETVMRMIDRAFAGLEPPQEAALLHPACRDDVDVAAFYGPVRRAAVSDAMVVREYAALSGFSAEAYRYYLPAYMLFALRHPGTVDYAPEALLHSLDPGTDGEWLHEFRLSKFDRLTVAQVEAVRAFLLFMTDDPDLASLARIALDNHWKSLSR